jgi:manganese transport protein
MDASTPAQSATAQSDPRLAPRARKALSCGGFWVHPDPADRTLVGGKLLAFLGPGYLVAVGYMDPGNWATSLAGGSKFGYALLYDRAPLQH